MSPSLPDAKPPSWNSPGIALVVGVLVLLMVGWTSTMRATAQAAWSTQAAATDEAGDEHIQARPLHDATGDALGVAARPVRTLGRWLELLAAGSIAGSLVFGLLTDRHLSNGFADTRRRVWDRSRRTGLVALTVLIGASALQLLPDLIEPSSNERILFQVASAVVLLLTFASALLMLRSTTDEGEKEPGSNLILCTLAAIVVAALLSVSLLSGTGLNHIASDFVSTTWGWSWLLRGLVLLLLLLYFGSGLRHSNASPRVKLSAKGALGGILIYLFITSMTGSADGLPSGSAWAGVVSFSHVTAASLWIGMVFSQVLFAAQVRQTLLRADRPAILATIFRHYGLAVVLFGTVIMASGLLSAFINLPRPEDLIETAYGRTLLAKLVVVAGLLVVSGVNTYVLRPRLVIGAEQNKRRRVGESWVKDEAKVWNYSQTELALAMVVMLASSALAVLVSSIPDTGGTDGDNTFGLPFELNGWNLAILLGAAAASIGLWVGSIPRQASPAGVLGQVGSTLDRIHVPPLLSLGLFIGVTLAAALALHAIRDEAVAPQQVQTSNPMASTPDSIEQGRLIFDRSCLQCHGTAGVGTSPTPTNLGEHVPSHGDEFLFDVITNGLGETMPAFGAQLSEAERWHLLNFLRAEFGGSAAE